MRGFAHICTHSCVRSGHTQPRRAGGLRGKHSPVCLSFRPAPEESGTSRGRSAQRLEKGWAGINQSRSGVGGGGGSHIPPSTPLRMSSPSLKPSWPWLLEAGWGAPFLPPRPGKGAGVVSARGSAAGAAAPPHGGSGSSLPSGAGGSGEGRWHGLPGRRGGKGEIAAASAVKGRISVFRSGGQNHWQSSKGGEGQAHEGTGGP